jgi:hypothetical protein
MHVGNIKGLNKLCTTLVRLAVDQTARSSVPLSDGVLAVALVCASHSKPEFYVGCHSSTCRPRARLKPRPGPQAIAKNLQTIKRAAGIEASFSTMTACQCRLEALVSHVFPSNLWTLFAALGCGVGQCAEGLAAYGPRRREIAAMSVKVWLMCTLRHCKVPCRRIRTCVVRY